jgi:hypothetical protein
MKSKHFAFLGVFSILAILVFVYSANAAPPNVTLKNGHIPTYNGIKQVWFRNTGSVPVHLSFTGPWDFTTAPKQKKLKIALVETKDAFNGDKFPDATFAYERNLGGPGFSQIVQIKAGLFRNFTISSIISL